MPAMEKTTRDQVIERLIERMSRAIVGENSETVRERYLPVLTKMTDSELSRVWERASNHSDSHLYLIDENVHNMLNKRGNSPLVGSFVSRMFDSVSITSVNPVNR